MNSPAAGWNPDPSGRHEYRYWDGGRWTDDVSDNGVTGTDALGGGGAAPGGDATAQMDPTRQFGQQPGPYAPGPDAPGGGPSGPYPSQFGSGGFPPATPPKKGPKPGLIIGIAAAAVALIAVVVVLAMQGGDDDKTDTASKSSQTTTTADGNVTLPPTTAAGGTTVPGNDGDGKISGVDEDVIKSAMTTAFENEGMTHEQAQCASQAMIDQFGDRLADIGQSSNPLAQLTSDDMSKLFDALGDCGIDPSTLGGG
ncbi:MAG TPA: DUF2510 domain-containing protein [Acidimicrobiales bacterium]|nr:DUF2510 domain-containing protein [Acidimicrobiales bacterium]